jgi:hypothetical protein
MFKARRDPSHGGVFHFVMTATTQNRGRGYECAGRPVAAQPLPGRKTRRRESP